ncbi:MAG: hypothetical protein J1E38_03580 [Paramuribaculum sp.]|nr:hypothetical protein [Paramuribaculum sp.]
MIKKALVFVVLLAGALSVSAQTDLSWMENAPDKYLPKNTQIVISPESPCNQNGEAFKDFIPKFRTDKAFRDSRVKFDADDEMGKMSFKMLADYNDGKGYQLLKAVQKKLRCDKSFGTWYNVSENEVCFRYEDVLPCNDWGGGSVTARFQRIDGKWYLTGVMLAG